MEDSLKKITRALISVSDKTGLVEFAQKLARENSQQSMELTKEMIANVQGLNLKKRLNYAAEMNANARGTADCQRGITSFLHKEKISW